MSNAASTPVAPVTYLVNQYPSVSHTFIRREIEALERQGIKVQRIALRGWDLPLIDERDLAERKLTRYVLKGGLGTLLPAVARTMLRSPMRLASALALTCRMARGSDRPLLVHLAYLVEACLILEWAAQAETRHLHAHFATNPAEVAMLVNALGGPPYSFTAHGSDIMDRPAQVGLEHTVARAAFVAAVCSFGRSQILKWVPHTLWAKVKVIHCGLAPGYGKAASAPDPMQTRLLCIGRLSKEKGQLLLVEAAHKLHQEGIPIQVTLAGDGPMRPEIEELVRRLGLVGHVEITGWLDSEGIEALLRASRALVVPSLSEGLPVVIMEAMANRRPVIAPYLAGIPELVSPGLSGWLFPAGDVDSLAQSMQACLTAAPPTLLAMGEAARQAVWRAHDSDREATGLAQLFGLSIIDNPRT